MMARVLVVATALALAGCATPLRAQGPWGPPAASRYAGAAYGEGYRSGERFGQQDGQRGATFNFSILADYRRGDRGYRSQYGARDRYRQDFRVGFGAGYRAGYERFARNRAYRVPAPPVYSRDRGAVYGGGNVYGRGYAGSDPTLNQGYNDGYEEGLNDGRKGHRDNPTAESRYHSADRGYERAYGPKDIYRSNYRRAFIEGYETGYREGWR
jgi:hypothetical protein